MLTPEQRELRRTMLTATDFVKLAGVHPLGRTAHEVYAEKVGIAADESEQSTASTIGHRLEPVALGMLAEMRGLTLTSGTTERHPIIPWLGATPDANVIGPAGSRIAVAEAKAVGVRMMAHWPDEDTGEPPEYVHVQVQIQMTVTRTQRAHVVALVGTEIRLYEVESDPELSGALLTLGERFWKEHVEKRVPPAPDGSESAKRMLLAAWPKHRAELLPADAYAEDWAREYLHARDQETRWAKKAERAKQLLCARIGDAVGVVGAGWKATWKATPPVEVKSFTRAAGRTFRLTEVKAKGNAA